MHVVLVKGGQAVRHTCWQKSGRHHEGLECFSRCEDA